MVTSHVWTTSAVANANKPDSNSHIYRQEMELEIPDITQFLLNDVSCRDQEKKALFLCLSDPAPSGEGEARRMSEHIVYGAMGRPANNDRSKAELVSGSLVFSSSPSIPT